MLVLTKEMKCTPVQLLAALPLALEVPLLPDLLGSVAVLLPQLLDHRASEGGTTLALDLGLLPVCFSHVTIWNVTGWG